MSVGKKRVALLADIPGSGGTPAGNVIRTKAIQENGIFYQGNFVEVLKARAGSYTFSEEEETSGNIYRGYSSWSIPAGESAPPKTIKIDLWYGDKIMTFFEYYFNNDLEVLLELEYELDFLKDDPGKMTCAAIATLSTKVIGTGGQQTTGDYMVSINEPTKIDIIPDDRTFKIYADIQHGKSMMPLMGYLNLVYENTEV